MIRAKYDTPDFPLILVGNKCDREEERQVSTDMVNEALQTDFLQCSYLECSAKDVKNIDEIFMNLVRIIREWRLKHSDSSEKKKKKVHCNII